MTSPRKHRFSVLILGSLAGSLWNPAPAMAQVRLVATRPTPPRISALDHWAVPFLRNPTTLSSLPLLHQIDATGPDLGIGPKMDTLASAVAPLRSQFSPHLPIRLPPGVRGLQPELALQYDPAGGNGIVGMGWSLVGLPSVSRINYGNGINYDGHDTYAHSTLGVLVAQSDGSYRSQKESFSKFVPQGTCADGPCYWIVYNRNGVREYYGSTDSGRTDSQSRAPGQPGIRTWGLAEAIDLFGNSYEVSYTDLASHPGSAGKIYPSAIIYSKGVGLSADRRVDFSYEPRSDAESGFYAGGYRNTVGRLTSLAISSAGALLRMYRLTYEYGVITGRSRLTRFQEYGSDGINTSPAHQFTYQDGSNALTSVAGSPWAVGPAAKTWVTHFYGDGRAEYSSYIGGPVNAISVTTLGNGLLGNTTWYGPAFLSNANQIMLGDFNADGKTDIAAYTGGTLYGAFANLGTFALSFSKNVPTWGDAQHTWVGDFEGTGSSVIVTWVADNYHMYAPRRGFNGWYFDEHVAPRGSKWGDSAHTWVADFNGDGKDDIATAYGGGFVYVDLSTGTGFSSQTWSVPNNWGDGKYTWCGDFNGDGKADIATAIGGNVYVNLSTGSSFIQQVWPVPNSWGDGLYTRAGDFDGDGKTDIATVNGGNVYVYVSNGSGFHQAVVPVSATWGHSDYMRVGDFNGDGRADFVLGSPQAFGGGVVSSVSAGGPTVGALNPDVLIAVRNGLGETVTAEYLPAPQVPDALRTRPLENGAVGGVMSDPRPTPLVTRVTVADGRGGSYSARYRYYDSAVTIGPPTSRRNLGIGSIETIDEQTGRRVRVLSREGRVGMVVEYDGPDDNVYARVTTVSYALCPEAGTCPAVASGYGTELYLERERSVMDLEHGAIGYRRNETYTYDRYGNLLIATKSTDGLPTVRATYAYDSDQSTWFLGKIREEKVESGATTLNWTRYYWTGYSVTTQSKWLDTNNSWLDTGMTYDANGNLTSVTLPAAADGVLRRTTYAYEDAYHVGPTRITNAANQTTRVAYVPDGQISTVTDANSNTTSFTYDIYGRKSTVTRPDGGSTAYYYESYGDPNAQRNRMVTSVDTTHNPLWQADYFDGTGFTYRRENNADCAQGDVAAVQYIKDAVGRLAQTSQPYCIGETPRWTTTTYDIRNRVSSVSTPDSMTTRRVYETTYFIDTDPNGKVRRSNFDARGRITTVADAANQTTSYSYDPLDRLLSVTLPNGAVNSFTYDSLNRRATLTDPQLGNRNVTFAYDGLNRLIRQQPAGGVATTFEYDDQTMSNGIGHLTKVTDASGITQFSYTNTGKLRAVTRNVEGGLTQVYEYDLAGRLTRVTYPDHSVVDYGYTTGGNLANVSLAGMPLATWSGYDARSLPASVAFANGVTTAYQYDIMNHMTSLSTTKGTATLQSLTYDWYTFPNTGGINLGKISDNRSSKTAADGSNTDETQTYSYDDLYRLTQAVGVWGTKQYTYDAIGNLTGFGGLADRTFVVNGQQVTSGTGLANVTYDAIGNMTHKELDDVSWSYDWTAENFLKTVWKNGVLTAEMVYDAFGQRARKVYTPETGPTVTTTYFGKTYEKRTYSDGTTPVRETIYIFANGNLVTQVTRPVGTGMAFKDANRWRGELAAASLYNGGNFIGAAKKAYHYLNAAALHPETLRRIVLVLFAAFATFVLAALLASKLGRDVPLRHFSPGLQLASLCVLMLFTLSACGGGGPGGEALYRARNYLLSGDTTKGPALGIYFVHHNHVNSSSVVTDLDGAEVTRIIYLPYGEISRPNSTGGDIVTSKFTGQEHDEETGLYYYNARYYDSAIGRFISADTIISDALDERTYNRYAYVLGNPIMHIDPSGHDVGCAGHDASESDGHGGYHEARDGSWGDAGSSSRRSVTVTVREVGAGLPTGHATIQVGDAEEAGLMPNSGLGAALGAFGIHVSVDAQIEPSEPDRVVVDRVNIEVSPQAAREMQVAIDRDRANPPGYEVSSHNCVDWVGGVLRTGGVNAPYGSFAAFGTDIDLPGNLIDHLKDRYGRR